MRINAGLKRINLLTSRIKGRRRDARAESPIRPLSEDLPRLINPPNELEEDVIRPMPEEELRRIEPLPGYFNRVTPEIYGISPLPGYFNRVTPEIYGISGYMGDVGVSGVQGFLRENRCYVNPKIGSPQEIEHLPRLRILELLIKSVAEGKVPDQVLFAYDCSVGFKLSDEVKEILYCYYDPEYKPTPKRTGRMIRVEEDG